MCYHIITESYLTTFVKIREALDWAVFAKSYDKCQIHDRTFAKVRFF